MIVRESLVLTLGYLVEAFCLSAVSKLPFFFFFLKYGASMAEFKIQALGELWRTGFKYPECSGPFCS